VLAKERPNVTVSRRSRDDDDDDDDATADARGADQDEDPTWARFFSSLDCCADLLLSRDAGAARERS